MYLYRAGKGGGGLRQRIVQHLSNSIVAVLFYILYSGTVLRPYRIVWLCYSGYKRLFIV